MFPQGILAAPLQHVSYHFLKLYRPLNEKYCHWLQIVVSLGSGPWDELFGGGNSPAFVVAALSAFAGGLIAILAIPRTRVERPKIFA